MFDGIYVQNYIISMKKILFKKFIKDTLKLFITMVFVLGLIVWVIQAVNFLDFVTEDGHSFYVYFLYSTLNFPKIIHRILPFVFFISLFYQIIKYETKNELVIFWSNGVKKIQFINVVIFYSILMTFFQIFLGSIVSPISQNEARSYIRNSNVDFFPSLIKEGKFIDTVSNLTIFIESKSKTGKYKNIFLKDLLNKKNEPEKFQVIYANSGILINDNGSKFFELYNGEMINKENNKITKFSFEKINFNLAKYVSKSTGYPKIQEVPSYDLSSCLYLDYKKRINEFVAEYLQCKQESIKDIKTEFLKRFYKPVYLPLIALMCCLLILKSKESDSYNKFKIFLFIIIFFIIVISEISLRFSASGNTATLFFVLLPILTFLLFYISLIAKGKL